MHSLSLLFMASLLLFTIPVITREMEAKLKEIPFLSTITHVDAIQKFNLSSGQVFTGSTYSHDNGSGFVNRQVNPEIPVWATPLAIRGAQTFVTDNIEEKNVLMDMMGQMWALAIAAVQSLGTPEAPVYSSSFLRYFAPDEWADVRDGFRALLGPICDRSINGPDELKFVRIYWDTGPVAFAEMPGMVPEASCASNPDGYGAGTGSGSGVQDDWRYWIVICPNVLDVKTVFNPFDCNLLADRRMSIDLITHGQMMLHELMHWPYISVKAVKDNIIADWNTDRIMGLPVDPNAVPRSGYGPYNAMLVNKLHGRGSQNLDNYAWFALESYLLQVRHGQCGGELDPPLTYFEDPTH